MQRLPYDSVIPTDVETARLMFTVSCFDSLFPSPRVNDGSYLTIDEAITAAGKHKARNPRTTSQYRIHLNPLGYGYVDACEVLCLLF